MNHSMQCLFVCLFICYKPAFIVLLCRCPQQQTVKAPIILPAQDSTRPCQSLRLVFTHSTGPILLPPFNRSLITPCQSLKLVFSPKMHLVLHICPSMQWCHEILSLFGPKSLIEFYHRSVKDGKMYGCWSYANSCFGWYLGDIWVISGRYLGDIWLFSRELDHMPTAARGALPHQAVARSSPKWSWYLQPTPQIQPNWNTQTHAKCNN